MTIMFCMNFIKNINYNEEKSAVVKWMKIANEQRVFKKI